MCMQESRCIGAVVSSGGVLTMKAAFNWSLGHHVAPEVTSRCERLHDGFLSRLRKVGASTACTASFRSQFRKLGCLDYSTGGAFGCAREDCARRVLTSPRHRPGYLIAASEVTSHHTVQPTCPGKRHAVISAAWGYNLDQLRPLVLSFYVAGLHAHTQGFLLVKDGAIDSQLVAHAPGWGWRLMRPGIDYDYNARLSDLGVDPRAPALSDAMTGRYFHTEALLRMYAHCFERVLLTDSRDAYFQAKRGGTARGVGWREGWDGVREGTAIGKGMA